MPRLAELAFRPLTLLLLTILAVGAFASAGKESETLKISGFAFEQEVRVAGTPEEVFDLFTGDVSGWWDHHFSNEPRALYIEPKPGGGFFEIFDEEGTGARHAVVTMANRGKELQFTGALGFASLGVALEMTHRFTFEAEEDGTVIRLSVHGMGEVQDGWAEAVRGVWHHFLVEQFKPYAERES